MRYISAIFSAFKREDEHMKVAVIVNELTVRGGTHKQVLRLCQYLEKKKINKEVLIIFNG